MVQNAPTSSSGIRARLEALADSIDPVELGVALAILDYDHPLLIAVQAAVEIRAAKVALREASHAICAGWLEMRARAEAGGTEIVQPGVGTERRGEPGEFCVPFEEIERRRRTPGPLAAAG